MKSIFSLILILLISELVFGQIKIIKATSQRTFAGIGGIFMNYNIEFKNKKSVQVEVDSVKSIADTSAVKFYFKKKEKKFYEIHFGQLLSQPEKCRTCPDINLKIFDLTKGVIIYYRKGEEKSFFKVTKFRQLPDIKAP
ncbi:MAG: hypothetical protein V1781_00945 [Bacteroidota bacterium]